MKYFTNDWFISRLPEEDLERIAEDYWNYIDSVFDKFPFTLKMLAKYVNLHDGIVLKSDLDKKLKGLL